MVILSQQRDYFRISMLINLGDFVQLVVVLNGELIRWFLLIDVIYMRGGMTTALTSYKYDQFSTLLNFQRSLNIRVRIMMCSGYVFKKLTDGQVIHRFCKQALPAGNQKRAITTQKVATIYVIRDRQMRQNQQLNCDISITFPCFRTEDIGKVTFKNLNLKSVPQNSMHSNRYEIAGKT